VSNTQRARFTVSSLDKGLVLLDVQTMVFKNAPDASVLFTPFAEAIKNKMPMALGEVYWQFINGKLL